MNKKVLFLALLMTALYASAENEANSPASDKQGGAPVQSGAEARAILRATPEQVLQLRKAAADRQEAMYKPITQFRELSNSYSLSLSPDDPTPVVNMLYLSPSTIQFIDASGEPWPVDRAEIVDGGFLVGSIVDNEHDNSIVLANSIPEGVAHITVFLAKESVPITLRVRASVNDPIYNKLTTIRVKNLGPQAKIGRESLQAVKEIGLDTDQDLNSVLYAVKPFGARISKTNNTAVLAWYKDGDLLVRSKHHIISPRIKRSQTGQGGYTAYRLEIASRVLAVDESGQIVEVAVDTNE